jgi:hypothetical protein
LSSNTNNATLTGSPTFTNSGSASYFTFNGSSQYATTLSAKYNQTYTGKTIMAAIRINASAWTNGVDQYRGFFGTSTGSRNFNTYIHQDSSNNLQIHFSAGGVGGLSSNITLTANTWYIVAVTHSTGGVVSYYLDGQAVGTNTGITFNQWASSSTENVGASDNFWYGDIGAIAIYSQALTADQIKQNYNALIFKYPLVFTTVGTTSWTAPAGITSVTYLVVAGGGGGGNGYDNAGGGGGGAGMVLTGTLAVVPGQSYTVTVGDGGTGGANARANNPGLDGNNSVFGTIIALGGGSGKGSRTTGAVGAAQVSSATAATGGTGTGGGAGGKGGGGAGGAGSANSGTTGGTGGAGVASTITGSSVTYGVGGAGANSGTQNGGSAGTTNRGNGGQAGGATSANSVGGGKGGSGIVVLKYGI